MSQKIKLEIVLKLAGEGGGYVIEGASTSAGWRFRRRVNDASASMLDDNLIINDTSQWLPTLDDALGLMNAAWPMLYPTDVHPKFVSPIRQRVLQFLGNKDNFEWNESRRGLVAERWQEAGVDLGS